MIAREAHVGRIDARLPRADDKLTLTGDGKLVLLGADVLPNKKSTLIFITGVLDIGPDLRAAALGPG